MVSGIKGTFDLSNIYSKDEVDELIAGDLQLYFKNVTSGISTYFEMNRTANGRPKNSSSQTISTTNTEIGGFISPNASDLGIMGLDSTEVSGHFHADVDSIVGKKTVNGWFQVYIRNSTGSETLITSSHLVTVDSTTEKSYEAHAQIPNDVGLNESDRIVIKLIANLSGGGGNPILTTYIQGDTLSRLELGSLGANFLTIGQADKNYIAQSEEGNLNVNSSDNWDDLDTINATQMEDISGTLNIKESWITTLWNSIFGTKDTDDLSEGSTNLYDNQSWNESHADNLYADISVTGGNPFDQSLNTTDGVNFTNITTDLIMSSDAQANITYSDVAEGYLVLDGVGDYVDISGTENTIDETVGTFTAWIKLDTDVKIDSTTRLVIALETDAGNDDFIRLEKTAANGFLMTYREDDVSVSANQPDLTDFDSWIFVAGTWNTGGNVILYTGDPGLGAVATEDLTGRTPIIADSLAIALIGETRNLNAGWKGDISDVTLWDTDLSQSELEDIFDEGRNPTIADMTSETVYPTNIISWWRFVADASDTEGLVDGTFNGNAFVSKGKIMGYNTEDFKVKDLILNNIFGNGFSITIVEALFSGSGSFGGTITASNNVKAEGDLVSDDDVLVGDDIEFLSTSGIMKGGGTTFRGRGMTCDGVSSASDTGTECCAYFDMICESTLRFSTATEYACSTDHGSNEFLAFCQ